MSPSRVFCFFFLHRFRAKHAVFVAPHRHRYAPGDMLALGWLPTEENVGRGMKLTSRMSKCPNDNAYEYLDGDNAE